MTTLGVKFSQAMTNVPKGLSPSSLTLEIIQKMRGALEAEQHNAPSSLPKPIIIHSKPQTCLAKAIEQLNTIEKQFIEIESELKKAKNELAKTTKEIEAKEKQGIRKLEKKDFQPIYDSNKQCLNRIDEINNTIQEQERLKERIKSRKDEIKRYEIDNQKYKDNRYDEVIVKLNALVKTDEATLANKFSPSKVKALQEEKALLQTILESNKETIRSMQRENPTQLTEDKQKLEDKIKKLEQKLQQFPDETNNEISKFQKNLSNKEVKELLQSGLERIPKPADIAKKPFSSKPSKQG